MNPGSAAPWRCNKLCFGDCLAVLDARHKDGRKVCADESVDLVYLDPPFNSQAKYNMIFGRGADKQAQATAFTDTWQWGGAGTADVEEIERAASRRSHQTITGLHLALGDSGMMAYLGYMAKRLEKIREKMKPTASIYLHCDPAASHYLKILMDGIFGAKNFRNEIVWCYAPNGRGPKNGFHQKHDAVLFYGKSEHGNFSRPYTAMTTSTQASFSQTDESGRRYKTYLGRKAYLDEIKGRPVPDWWTDIPRVLLGKARLGYPTQKPRKLLERIILASSNPGDLVLDPFCGCATTIAAAELLGRQWIGVDISAATIRIVANERKELGGKRNYEVFGIPHGMEEARKLAQDDRLQYENWAISTVPGLGLNNKKNERGFDGFGHFLEITGAAGGKPVQRSITAEVKSSKSGVTAKEQSHLKTHAEKNGSVMGIFLTLEEDAATEKWCRAQGFYQMPGSPRKYPRFQVYSAAQYFAGGKPDLPTMLHPVTGREMHQSDILD
ncbi:MAG: DNA methyltransferase [Gammaproteobacteria bacterium]|nr:DNA methyltransferase [Gammaproteobacteria bacterium]